MSTPVSAIIIEEETIKIEKPTRNVNPKLKEHGGIIEKNRPETDNEAIQKIISNKDTIAHNPNLITDTTPKDIMETRCGITRDTKTKDTKTQDTKTHDTKVQDTIINDHTKKSTSHQIINTTIEGNHYLKIMGTEETST